MEDQALCRVITMGLCVLAAACARPRPGPEVASSADLPGYAMAWGGRLAAADRGFDAAIAETRQSIAGFAAFPDQLAATDWALVREVIALADREGRGRAYAEARARDEAVRDFFDEARDDIVRRVSGAAQSAVNKEVTGVDIDVSGSVSYALKEGVNRQLEKRRDASSEARGLIARNEERLGKKNLEKLRDQADRVALASHRVHVEIPAARDALERMRGEADRVKETLDDAIEAETKAGQAPDLSKERKKASDERLEALRRARAEADAAIAAYKRTPESLEAEIDHLAEEHAKAVEDLLEALEARAEAEPVPAGR